MTNKINGLNIFHTKIKYQKGFQSLLGQNMHEKLIYSDFWSKITIFCQKWSKNGQNRFFPELSLGNSSNRPYM